MLDLKRRHFFAVLGSLPLWPVALRQAEARPAVPKPLTLYTYLAGMPYHAGYDWYESGQLCAGDRLTLRPEPDNPHDEQAVEVWHQRLQVKLGYVPRHKNAALSAYLQAGAVGRGQIVELDEDDGPWRGVRLALTAGWGVSWA